MTVGLILVSHSADLARGSAELARQMAPSVVDRTPPAAPTTAASERPST